MQEISTLQTEHNGPAKAPSQGDVCANLCLHPAMPSVLSVGHSVEQSGGERGNESCFASCLPQKTCPYGPSSPPHPPSTSQWLGQAQGGQGI